MEAVTNKIPSTLEAGALCKMADRGQIVGGILDGPLAFDNAIDEKAARTKGIRSPVAGKADILVVPDLEAGNMLAKQLTFMAGAEAAGIVFGVRLDEEANRRGGPRISASDSPVPVWIIPTDEELMIALHVRDEWRLA